LSGLFVINILDLLLWFHSHWIPAFAVMRR